MQNILLTGASGFVGQALLRQLANNDHLSITVICREQSRNTLPAQQNLHQVVVTDSIFDKDQSWWQARLSGIDTVIHSAWYVDPQDYLSSEQNICLPERNGGAGTGLRGRRDRLFRRNWHLL